MTDRHEQMFTNFRADGWPLCPTCGEDELYSLATYATLGTIEGCYRCGWRPPPVLPNQYRCGECGEIYNKGRTDEEAMSEAKARVGGPVVDPVVVCDDCHEKIMARMKRWN